MKPLDLDVIEARASRAAPGPWEDAEGSVWENGQRRVDEAFVRRPGDSVAVASSILNPCADPWDVPSQDTAIFIAHAREDVPALVAEVRRLRADLTAMTASRDGWREIVRTHVDAREDAPQWQRNLTAPEAIAHARAHNQWTKYPDEGPMGMWLWRDRFGSVKVYELSVTDRGTVYNLTDRCAWDGGGGEWLPLDVNHLPCARTEPTT